jgi:orotate phosphoribosyltransferase
MNFRSIAQLSDQLLAWSRELPQDIEVVAGVPRSGLLAANLLGLYLNRPITDVDGLLAGRYFSSGTYWRQVARENGNASNEAFLSRPRTVLVLDDSLLSGRSMREVRARIDAANLPHRILYGAVYVAPPQCDAVDLYCEVVNEPRVFEWNVMRGMILRKFCISLDGVLCSSPTAGQQANARAYEEFVADARPLFVPSTEIGWIVADRPAALREETESWLRRHGYRYRNLVMLDVPRDGTQGGSLVSTYKADLYRSTDALLFIEGSFRQSVEISRMTGRHVLCTHSMQLIHPGTVPLLRTDLPLELHPPAMPTFAEFVTRLTKSAARRVLPVSAQEAIRRHRYPSLYGIRPDSPP